MKNEWIFAFLTAILPILKSTYDFILKLYKMKHDERMKKLENATKKKAVPKKLSQSSPAPKA